MVDVSHRFERSSALSAVRVAGASDVALHSHRSIVLGHVLAGQVQLHLGAQVLTLRAQDGFMIPAGIPHALHSDGAALRHVMALPAGFVGLGIGCVTSAHWGAAFEALFAQVMTRADRIVALDTLSQELFEVTPAASISRAPVIPRQVLAAHRLVLSDLEAPLTLADLAREVGLSAFHLHRLYRRAYGVTPAEHRTEARLRRARALILRGLPLAQAGSASGFCDQSHLNRAFRRLMSVSPGVWRRQVWGEA